jgi:hypothetical protein
MGYMELNLGWVQKTHAETSIKMGIVKSSVLLGVQHQRNILVQVSSQKDPCPEWSNASTIRA